MVAKLKFMQLICEENDKTFNINCFSISKSRLLEIYSVLLSFAALLLILLGVNNLICGKRSMCGL